MFRRKRFKKRFSFKRKRRFRSKRYGVKPLKIGTRM